MTASALTLDLRVLLIGQAADPETAPWQATLASEGVPYTLVQPVGSYGSETVALPPLSAGNVGYFNAVILAGTPQEFATGQLDPLGAYESSFGIRQIDGYFYPSGLGLTPVFAGVVSAGTVSQLAPGGMAALPELKGPIPFDTPEYGYSGAVVAGAPFTTWMTDPSGNVQAGVYQHPVSSTDPQSGVSELVLTFSYYQTDLDWLLLAPGLTDWVTQGVHLGLYRNYFGMNIDDTFLADNEWSSQYQCTPSQTAPVDFACPLAVQGNAAAGPPNSLMSPTDVAYVMNWEQQNGITLQMLFNGWGACTAPSTTTESQANCSGSATVGGTTYTDPGFDVSSTYTDTSSVVNAFLANKSAFNWANHTWQHNFLGCDVWQQPTFQLQPGATSGSLAASQYTYEITVATAYGESEPSVAAPVTPTNGSVTLTWADATNGGGPALWQLESRYSGGSGFWGYHIYRVDPGSSAFQLVGEVPEDPTGATPSYAFTDDGSAVPGGPPSTDAVYPTATNPGIECSSWVPATSGTPDASIQDEIGLNDAFAINNGLPTNPADLVTGEHSGLENPNMGASLAATGVTVIGSDASRQPNQYSLSNAGATVAQTAPRYPSNIYYNVGNWPDEINEYNTLYVQAGTSIGDPNYPGEVGRCVNTSSTTCLSAPATESSLVASESHIMLKHVLANNPRVGFAHQSNLVGPETATVNGQTADYGYVLLRMLDSVLAQYRSWYTAPLEPITLASEATYLGEQASWASGQSAVSASITNGVITVDNSGSSNLPVPLTAPATSYLGTSPFGESYGGYRSAWLSVAPQSTATVTTFLGVTPTITSASSAKATVGSAFTWNVTTTGTPAPAITESGALPAGLTFTDNGNGTATLAGTPQQGAGGVWTINITAQSVAGTAGQVFVLTVSEAPAFTSPATASAFVNQAFSFTVTTVGYPYATLSHSPLPAWMTWTGHANGTATLGGTPPRARAGSVTNVTLTAKNALGTATQVLAITVYAVPAFTSGPPPPMTVGSPYSFLIKTVSFPYATMTETGSLPGGITFVDNGDGTATLSGTPQLGSGGLYNVVVTATNIYGTATAPYQLKVREAPSITSAAVATGVINQPFNFLVTTLGYPYPNIKASGLPKTLKLTNNNNGTATISGTPTSTGRWSVTVTASNGLGTASQLLTITITS